MSYLYNIGLCPCLVFQKDLDKKLLNLVNRFFDIKIEDPSELPLVFKQLRENGRITEEQHRKLVGLLLEIDGIIEEKINGEINEKDCKESIEEKYNKIFLIIRSII